MNRIKNIGFWFIIILFLCLYLYYDGKILSTFGLDLSTFHQDTYQDNLVVQFLNVGEADSIFIRNKDEAMLIDAGNNEDGSLLVSYFQSIGVKKFNYLVGTHPHEDHIGGLDSIISSFPVENIYMPDVVTTTSSFKDVLKAIEQKHLTISIPTIGEEWYVGDALVSVIYTGNDSDDLNGSSIVLRLDYGSASFLFMADAPDMVENQILNRSIDIDVDVLKVGHHGSTYSNSFPFLEKVSPKYAIISCGEDNDYYHPHIKVLKRLKRVGATIYRTDQMGTISVSTDGKNYSFELIPTNLDGGNE